MDHKAHINNERIQTCKEHSLNTAKYSGQILESVNLKNTGFLCGLLHDVGKCTDEFNAYIGSACKGEDIIKGSVIHSFAGLNLIMSKYHKDNDDPIDKLTAELISIAIGSHHGLFDIYNTDSESGFERRFNKQPKYDKNAIENFYKECVSEEEIDKLFKESKEEINSLYLKVINGLSDDEGEVLFYLNILERLILSSLIEGDRKDTAEFMLNKSIDSLEATGDTWEKAYTNLINFLNSFPQKTEIQVARKEISSYCEQFANNPCGVYRLNLPTGSGKTLSSLRYALTHAKKYHKKRIIFATPLLSILDQNAKVIKEAINDDSLILEHHSNVVCDNLSLSDLQRREMLVDTWDSPIIITTLVQLLNTMFDGKTSSIRRFHGLTDSIIVIDEVQSVPMKMLSLFNLTVNFLSKMCNTTFLLCSATQPLFEDLKSHKMLINSEEVIPRSKTLKYEKIFKRTEIKPLGDMNSDEIKAQIEEYYKMYGSVLVVCNTKRETCELYKKAKNISDNVIHLSTSMCMAHRKDAIEKMEALLNKKEPLICISTQLIEAGVDVSFGAVIRLAAGIDNITQAAGRANRNGESKDLAPVGIIYKKGEDLSKLAEIKNAKDATGKLLFEYSKDSESFKNDLISAESVNYYYKALFCELSENYTNYCFDNKNMFDLLSVNGNNLPEKENPFIMSQAFKTAGEAFKVFDDFQISVIIPYKNGKNIIDDILSDRFIKDIKWAKKIVKKAKDITVNLYDNQVEKLKEAGAVYTDKSETVLILKPNFYDDTLGVIL